MAAPFINTIHTDKLLSNVSIKYQHPDLIADKIFPIVPVKNRSDLYRIYTRNFRVPQTIRSTKGIAREEEFEVTTGAYRLVEHALSGFIPDRNAENYDVGDLRVDMTEELTRKVMLRMELDVSNLFTTTSWSLNVSLAAGADWDTNTFTSDPIPTTDTGMTTVIANSGYTPNTFVLNREAFIAVKNHTSVADRVKYTTAEITENLLARLIGVEKFLVSKASQDTANEGLATTLAAIWGDVAFLGYVPPRASPLTPASGYVFMNEMPPVRKWRDEPRKGEYVEVQKEYDAKVVASLSGYLIKDVI